MKLYLSFLILLFFTKVSGQTLFDSLKVEKALMSLPIQRDTALINGNLINAIEAIDKNYRKIADTLYYYKSLNHTIFQTILIETNDSVLINPLSFGNRIHFSNIVFDNKSLNSKVEKFAGNLRKTEKAKLFKYLTNQFDNFSISTKKFNPQAVRIRYIKFLDERLVNVGIDIYGTHFLWTIDRSQNWNVVKVESLWNY